MKNIIPWVVLAIGIIGAANSQELNTKNSKEIERYNQEVSQNVAKIADLVPLPQGVIVKNFTQNIWGNSTTIRWIFLSQKLTSLPGARIDYGVWEATSSFNSNLLWAIENKTAMHPQIRFEMKF